MYQFQVTQDDLKKFGTRNSNNHNEDSKCFLNNQRERKLECLNWSRDEESKRSMATRYSW